MWGSIQEEQVGKKICCVLDQKSRGRETTVREYENSGQGASLDDHMEWVWSEAIMSNNTKRLGGRASGGRAATRGCGASSSPVIF